MGGVGPQFVHTDRRDFLPKNGSLPRLFRSSIVNWSRTGFVRRLNGRRGRESLSRYGNTRDEIIIEKKNNRDGKWIFSLIV